MRVLKRLHAELDSFSIDNGKINFHIQGATSVTESNKAGGDDFGEEMNDANDNIFPTAISMDEISQKATDGIKQFGGEFWVSCLVRHF